MIKVLVVDDSAFMRKTLSMILNEPPDIQVVDTARDGIEAIDKVKQLKPDVVTLDIEMPRMDGLQALQHIMQHHPVPVIMVSSLTQEGARETIRALELGAVDFIPKQFSFVSLEINNVKQQLIEKVRAAAKSRLSLLQKRFQGVGTATRTAGAAPTSRKSLSHPQARIVVIGISTGGPLSLQKVMSGLPGDFPIPIAIVQHMPPNFTRSLAERLNSLSKLTVVEAGEGMPLQANTVYIAQGGKHLHFVRRMNTVALHLSDKPDNTFFKPSVDELFFSAAEIFGGRIIGVVMTGMGKDGLEGARRIKALGGKIIAQDAATSVVYGMPRAVAEAGLADAVLPLEQIAPALSQAIGLRAPAVV